MGSRGFIASIGVSSGPAASIPEEIFRAFKRGEMGEREYQVGNAAWVADNLWKYNPQPYPPLADRLCSYARSRSVWQGVRDESQAQALGIWLAMIHRAVSENTGNQELLLWCKSKCLDAGMKERAAKIDEMLRNYHAHRLPEITQAALDAQKHDMEEKRRSARRSEGG